MSKDIHLCLFTNCEYASTCMHMYMYTYGCIDIHMPGHLVHAYADICIHTHTYAYIWKHMCTATCIKAYVCICRCIPALGRGKGASWKCDPTPGERGGGQWAWDLMPIYIYIYIYIYYYIYYIICGKPVICLGITHLYKFVITINMKYSILTTIIIMTLLLNWSLQVQIYWTDPWLCHRDCMLLAAYIGEYLGRFIICCLVNFDIWFAILGAITRILAGLVSLGLVAISEDWVWLFSSLIVQDWPWLFSSFAILVHV